MTDHNYETRYDPPPFAGETYEQDRDGARLRRQLDAVRDLMMDFAEHTLDEIARRCGCTTNSASARVRDLRKAQNGGWTVHRRHISNGVFGYRLDVRNP